jgi:hypothetical protein
MIDSEADTRKHIRRVNELLGNVAIELIKRGQVHDESKLHDPEKPYFDNATDLKTLVFGSEEYRLSTEAIKPALDHHYANNDHHPQFWPDGINDMSLIHLIEMIVDWKASGERNDKGDIMKSIEINANRFGMSKQLKRIFENTAKHLFPDAVLPRD